MVSWPDLGTRVTVRYRRRAGSIPPLTDAVGHLLAVDPMVRVQTKTGAVVECARADVVALRALTDAPVRTWQIRALERAAATARSGGQQTWLHGWLARADADAEGEANSAVPLDISASADSIPAIVAWYAQRARPPRLLIPERLLPVPAGLIPEREERMLVRDGPLPDGALPAFVCVDERDTDAIARAESQGFRLHHRRWFFRLRPRDG